LGSGVERDGAVLTGVDCDVGRYVEWVARRTVATMNRGQVREPYKVHAVGALR